MSNDIFRKFNSLHEFNEYLNAGTSQPAFKGRESSLDTTDYDFYRTQNYEEAEHRMIYGDKKLSKKIEDAGLKKALANIYRHRTVKQLRTGVVGAIPNVPAYIAGTPNSMIYHANVKKRQRVVNVAYNMAVSGGVSGVNIIMRAARLLSALAKIEAAGTQVNLYAVNLSENEGSRIAFAIKIKSAGQKFDFLKMAYPIAHPSMNRRQKFRFIEITEGVPSHFKYGYGYAINDEKEIINHFAKRGLHFDAAFSCETLGAYNYSNADEIAKKILGGGK